MTTIHHYHFVNVSSITHVSRSVQKLTYM